ncbi:hypothetical protein [Streptomyces sp. NRRL F-5727]|nr:hypothetical protein [Streptomyces sp. NRRL F-5727]
MRGDCLSAASLPTLLVFDLPAHTSLLLAGGPLDPTGALPADTAVWLRA